MLLFWAYGTWCLAKFVIPVVMRRIVHYGWTLLLTANALSSLGGYDVRTGSHVPNAAGWALFAGCCVVYGFTYWIVRREVTKKWDPVLARLRRLLADLLGATEAHVGAED